jgi:hypothetical protein
MTKWPIFLAALGLSVAAKPAGDSKPSVTTKPPGDSGPAGLESETTRILAHHCDGCHESSSAKHKDAALEVFDLSRQGWVRPLSDERLAKLIGRLEAKGTRDEVRLVTSFIDAERARREARPPPMRTPD